MEFLLNKECPKLLCGLGIGHRRRQTIPMWNSSGEREFFRASLYVWCLRYWALCDDLVVSKCEQGHILVFSIDTVPQWILWKRSKEDWSFQASRDSRSSSISHTLLVFRHLLQVQRGCYPLNFLNQIKDHWRCGPYMPFFLIPWTLLLSFWCDACSISAIGESNHKSQIANFFQNSYTLERYCR